MDIPKETVRRKVDALCKSKQLEYSVTGGVTVGDNFEVLEKKIAPSDLSSIEKSIKAIERNGGITKILRNFKNN